MIILGLTGSIGMGKSTTAKMFGELGVPVHDSDEAVHRFYRTTAVPMIEDLFPDSVVDGVVDRNVLARLVVGNPEAMKRLEGIVHPLVRADADAFLERHRITKEPLVVLDIPLLFETGGLDRVDRVAVVSAAPYVQRARVLARPGMTQEKFEAILARQTPDTEKRARADYLIDTGSGIESARRRVADIVEELTSKSSQALAGDKAEQAAR